MASNNQKYPHRKKSPQLTISACYVTILLLLNCDVTTVKACGPGTGPSAVKRKPPQTVQPFSIFESKPRDMSELALGAAGPLEGAIEKNSEKWNELSVLEFDSDLIVFDNDEARRMNRRCKTLIEGLSKWVMLRWNEKHKLQIKKGWVGRKSRFQEVFHSKLHYEGRALDIRLTGNLDDNQMGELATLAFRIGFDWVQYQLNYVHVSCVSDKYDSIYPKGCFSGDSLATTSKGTKIPVSRLQPGDKIKSFDRHGNIVDDVFLAHLDSSADDVTNMINIRVGNVTSLQLTSNHLVFVADDVTSDITSSKAVFAGRVEKGDLMLINDGNGNMTPVKVTQVFRKGNSPSGVYAPMTYGGRIMIDDVAASCYAVVECESCAHSVLAPLRWYYYVRLMLGMTSSNNEASVTSQSNVSLYSRILHYAAKWIVPTERLWPSEL